jgi:hypothetical protein
MRYKNNFVIHTTEQLIDINKSIKNFEADITITSNNEDDNFDIVIVTQKQLDDSDFNLNYKNITHYVNVNVKSKKNDINDYVLVIRSNNKTSVDIVIDLVDIDSKNIMESIPIIEETHETIDDDIISEIESVIESDIDIDEKIVEHFVNKNTDTKPKGSGRKWLKYLKYLLVFAVVGLCIYFLFFTTSKEKEKKDKKGNEIKEVVENESTELFVSNDDDSVTVSESGDESTSKSKKSKRSKSKNVTEQNTDGQESLLEQLRRIREQS